MVIHVVTRGETLWEIALLYGSSVHEITAANELLDPNQLVIGQSLVIPIVAFYHTVRGGDTIWKIAQRYGIKTDAIIQANQLLNPSALSVGIQILIPPRTHVMQAGETLWQIAQWYRVPVQELIEINRIQNPNNVQTGMVLTIPFPKPSIDVNAYVMNMGETGAKEVREVANLLTYMSSFGYTITSKGEITPIQDEVVIEAALENNIVPMMSITNFTSQDPGTDLAHQILSNTALQDQLLKNIISTMRAKGYRGLNIDFENVRPDDRELFNQFLQRTVDRLRPLGYFVSTAVAPKTSADQKGLSYEAHDYEAHGRIVDFVILMTYDWGHRLSSPQALSPLNQMKRVIDYAISVIPRKKLMMGFELYARDWLLPHVKGQEAETFDMQEAMRRALHYRATIQYDVITQSPFYRYTDEQGRKHEVWFEDARSAQAKFELAKHYGLKGISYWVLGYPFPQNWLLLEDSFRVRKRTE